jgi:hypothetical protein
MTPKKLVQRLESADEKLRQVRQHLIRCEPLDHQVVPLLHQIAEIIKSVASEQELVSGGELAEQLLKDIHTRTERARVLLESAAMLTCHSALTKPLIEGSYTPDGKLPSIEFGGRLIVHA